MPKHPKVTDDELVTVINAELVQVQTESFELISQQRIESNYAFTNQFTAATTPNTNMSRVNLYFTPSAVQTLTMHQSKVFCSDKKTVEFMPSTRDVTAKEGADQLSKAVNYVLHRENPGFDIITELFRSAAVNKNSIAKTVWGEEREAYEETYEDIDAVQLQLILDEKEAAGYECEITDKKKPTSQTSFVQSVDEMTGEVLEVEETTEIRTYTIRCSKMRGKIAVNVLPPEEFVIN